MDKIKTILMSGTDSGCRYIHTLEKAPGVNISLVVTGSDKPAGRGRKNKKPQVARYCFETGVNVMQTSDVNSAESVNRLKSAGPETALVVDFGQILSEEVLDIFPGGCFNIHYSLLPDLRGAAPVRWALMKGYEKTGVTAMKMNDAVDAGQIIFKREVQISSDDNYRSLKDKLTTEGIKLTEKLFGFLSRGRDLPLKNQDPEKATRTRKIGKEICRLNWDEESFKIVNRIRALAPEPGCWCVFQRKNIRLRILKARSVEAPEGSAKPGEVVAADKKTFSVKAATGAVEILEVHPAGKRPMRTGAFLAGNPVKPGDVLK